LFSSERKAIQARMAVVAIELAAQNSPENPEFHRRGSGSRNDASGDLAGKFATG